MMVTVFIWRYNTVKINKRNFLTYNHGKLRGSSNILEPRSSVGFLIFFLEVFFLLVVLLFPLVMNMSPEKKWGNVVIEA